jgi:hypothetical protein
MLDSHDGPGGDDLRDLQDKSLDWGKGTLYILCVTTDAKHYTHSCITLYNSSVYC